jgi:REP element-mobilizing transposase RayT
MARPRRISGFSYVGLYRYSLTFCTRDRHCAFRHAEVVALALLQFRRSAADCSFALVAYCFMPDHVHLLVEGLANHSNLAAFAKRAKQRSGRAYADRFDRPLWKAISSGYSAIAMMPGRWRGTSLPIPFELDWSRVPKITRTPVLTIGL